MMKRENPIYFKSGYDHQLTEDFTFQLPMAPGDEILKVNSFKDPEHKGLKFVKVGPFLWLFPNGRIKFWTGYAWDGMSFGIDSKRMRKPTLLHDGLCQAMNEGVLDPEIWWPIANKLLRAMAVYSGVWKIRAFWINRFVKFWGHVRSGKPKTVYKAY